MRYRILTQLIELCSTLSEAAEYLATASDDKTADMLFETCGEMLKAMLSNLEVNSEAIKDATLICNIKNIYDIVATKSDIAKTIDLIAGVKNKLINGVSYRYKIVIFAELGEKWDSLESVYEAFTKRDDCDVSVVLAPIFREVNGKKEVIYKDYLTSQLIPFIDYKSYDIEKDMPDLAFTCQPYESVTEPMFWAQNIAKHTRLVYVPYYAAYMFYNESVNTMCRMPIFDYSWKVIGSSQKHYDFYRKYASNSGKNMLVTGVPKWDGVVKLKKNGISKPLEAFDIKLKGKTVFLWNSFYDPSSSSLCYWREILQYFEAHSDCGLIWRMHPMTKTVIGLYSGAKALENLMAMETLSKQLPNVVVDTNASYYQAFEYSDAQISDFSSMMTQYLLMDKPLLWMKNSGRMPTEYAIDNAWMETADNVNDIIEFFDNIRAGKDDKKELREAIRKRDIPLADGQSGKRVCDITIELLRKETIG